MQFTRILRGNSGPRFFSGFLAEVATLPTAPLSAKGVDEMALRVSRLLNNDRGALHYRNVGEVGKKKEN